MNSSIDDLDIDESPEAERGLSISERVTCILISAEHAIEHAKLTPDVASLTAVVKRLLSMLVSQPERPSSFQERVAAIARGANRHAVIAGAIAEILAGDIAVVDQNGYFRAHKFIGVFDLTWLMVTSRDLMPLATLYNRLRSNPSALVQEIVAIADRRLAGESLDTILNPQRPLVSASDPNETKQARVDRRRQAREGAAAEQKLIRQTKLQERQQAKSERTKHRERFAKAIRNGQLWLDGQQRGNVATHNQAYQLNQRDEGAVSRCLELLGSHQVSESVDKSSFVRELFRWTNLLQCKSQNEKPHRRNRQKRPDISTSSCDNHSNVLGPELN